MTKSLDSNLQTVQGQIMKMNNQLTAQQSDITGIKIK